jgi:tetratricopeptide (TPR) repeat protein
MTDRRPRTQSVFLICWAIVWFSVLVAYANSFDNEFHFDDFHTVTDNPAIRSLTNFDYFFTDAKTFSVLPANRTYRPLISASLALDYALGHGYVPFWFHLSTFLWFSVLLGCLYLLYETVLNRTDSSEAMPYLALGITAWFGLHPAMAETVNYVIQRGDLYCTIGCCAALVMYTKYPRWHGLGLYLLPLLVALLCKPPAAIFPLLLLFYVFFFEAPEGRHRWAASARAIIPSLAITALALWLQSAMTPKTFAPSILSPWDYRLTQPFVWLRYFVALFLPIHLNVDSDLGPVPPLSARALLGYVFIVGLAAAIWFTARRRTFYPIAFGLLWFVLTQLPTSLYPLSELENDHRMFFSFVGLMLAVVWSANLLMRRLMAPTTLRRFRPVWIACVVLALSGYAWGVHVRNRVWRTEESLWLDDVQKSPHNGRGLMIYGLTQMNKGAYPAALGYFNQALLYTPNYATLEINLGVVSGLMHDNQAAEQHFQRALQLQPADDLTHAYYGRWLLGEGRASEAVEQERTAITLNPQRPMERDVLLTALSRTGDSEALRLAARETLAAVPGDTFAASMLQSAPSTGVVKEINQSLTEYQQGQYRESIESAQRALAIDPKSPEAYNNIGAALGALGQWDEAIANEVEALKLNPKLQIAENNRAAFEQKKRLGNGKPEPTADDLVNQSVALNRVGKYAESIATAQAAIKLNPRSAAAWNNIAANYEAMAKWDDAINAAKRAIELQPDFQLAKNNLAWSESQKAKAAKH